MPQPLPDPTWSDSTDVCIACGYALSGLAVPGLCPECGVSFGAGQLILHGVSQGNRAASPWRRLAWVAVIGSGFFSLHITVLLLTISWILAVLYIALMVGSVVWLLVTGPRDRDGVERFVFSPAGVARLPLTDRSGSAKFDAAFAPWTGKEAVELRRVSTVWRRIRIGRRYRPGAALIEIAFAAGVRCPDPLAGRVVSTIESYIAGAAPVTSAPAAPPTLPGS